MGEFIGTAIMDEYDRLVKSIYAKASRIRQEVAWYTPEMNNETINALDDADTKLAAILADDFGIKGEGI